MTKLKLGYCINLPLENKKIISEKITENIKLIKSWSKKFYCIQIMFSKKNISLNELEQIKKVTKNYKEIYVHASYQINIGNELLPFESKLYNTNLYNIDLEILINEIIFAKKINAKGIILHMGKNVKNKYDSINIYNNMVKFIIELFKVLKEKKITKILILIETSAGQGGEMCWNLNEFVEFIQKFSNLYFYEQLGICIDTCHIFQAGYDLNNLKVIKQLHELFTAIKNKIKLIHLNDSYHILGKHIDRHEQIGKGNIDTNKLIKFIYPYKLIPMILETLGPYEDQINKISVN